MFSQTTELANSPTHPFDPAARADDSCGRATDMSPKARKAVQNCDNYKSSHGGEVQFRPDNLGDESGICSPPLWKTSPSHPRHHHRQSNHRHQSPPQSRAQAIARGQRELMEMVKNMPESSYELSMKDIVEQTGTETLEECLIGEKNSSNQSSNQRVAVRRQESKKSERKVKMVRSGSMENKGLLLNMVFPVGLGSKKKKKSIITKVSPRPESSEKSLKGVDKEWWKKRFSASVESESSGTSSRSGSRGSSGSTSRSSSSRSNSGRYEILQENFRISAKFLLHGIASNLNSVGLRLDLLEFCLLLLVGFSDNLN